MSSWRNAIPKRKYKERGQPTNRKNLGFLEKKKDYKKRAKHYHKIEDTLKSLQEKAYNKNPDEFYFKMINSEIVRGKHKRKQSEPEEKIVKKRKTMDISLLNMQAQIIANKKEKYIGTAHPIDCKGIGKHMRFDIEQEDQEDPGQEGLEELEAMSKDEKHVKDKLYKLEQEKLNMKKGKKWLVDEDQQTYKWFRERKR